MKRPFLIFAVSSVLASESYSKCIPAYEYVPFAGVAAEPSRSGNVYLGTYSRISPDGKYVMRSLSGDNLSRVTVMELRSDGKGGKEAVAYQTSFENEAFPVQGSWRFLNNVGGESYRLKDILQKQKNAEEQFKGGISGFYATAAELPGGTDSEIKIRSLSWPNSNNQDAPGQLKNRMITIRKRADGSYQKTSESQDHLMCSNLKATEGNMFSLPMISPDGKEFAAQPQNPKNGRVSMRVYSFGENEEDCKFEDDTNAPSSKAIFGYAQNGKKAPVVFLSSGVMDGETKCRDVFSEMVPDPLEPKEMVLVKYDPPKKVCWIPKIPVSGIHLYDRDLKRTFYVGDRSAPLTTVDSFPGMTKDGRVVFGAQWNACQVLKRKVNVLDKNGKPELDENGVNKTTEESYNYCVPKTGYVIADPNQSEDMKRFRANNPKLAADMKSCITTEEVAKVEADQAVIYGLTPAVKSNFSETPKAVQ